MFNLCEILSSRVKLLCGNLTREPVILCIGSDRVTGDCLGPLTGHILVNQHNVPAYVYGTLKSPVNALNLVETVDFISLRHPQSLVIAVDSSLGKSADIGKINVIAGGIFPGAAAGKKLPKVGNISVTATVAEVGKPDLYGVRLGFVYSLAKNIAEALFMSLPGQEIHPASYLYNTI